MVVAFDTDLGKEMGALEAGVRGLEFQGSDTHIAAASFVSSPSVRSSSEGNSSSLLLEQQVTLIALCHVPMFTLS